MVPNENDLEEIPDKELKKMIINIFLKLHKFIPRE